MAQLGDQLIVNLPEAKGKYIVSKILTIEEEFAEQEIENNPDNMKLYRKDYPSGIIVYLKNNQELVKVDSKKLK